MIINNEDINTDEHIFITIADIESDLKSSNPAIIIIFDKYVKFVNPLFLLLLIDLQYKYKNILIIDMISLDNGDLDNRQYVVHWTLSYYSSLKLLNEKPKYVRKKNRLGDFYIDYSEKNVEPLYGFSEKRRQSHYDKNINSDMYQSGESKIFYYYSKTSRDNLAMHKRDHFTFIPIIKLSNHYSEFNLETDSFFGDSSAMNDPSKYIELPEGIQEIVEKTTLDIKGNFTRKSIEEIVKKVYDRNNKLNEVIYEIFDNIRQHTIHFLDNNTKKIANAYMSFRHNKKDKIYELIIGDTFEKGFLESYNETLQNELMKLRKQAKTFGRNLSKDFDEVYNRDIYRLDSEYKTTKQCEEDEKEVLAALFSVDNASNTENAFSTHQLRRIIMHFGIPTLIRIINRYTQHENRYRAKVDIFIHRDNRFYKVVYDGEETIVEFLGNKGVKGTFYHITLDDKYIPIEDTLSTNARLDIEGFKRAFINKDTISDTLKDFADYSIATNSRDIESIKIDYRHFEKGEINNFDNDIKFYTVGAFLRNMYKYAFLRNTQNIMVLNFPLDKFSNYLYDLIRIIYPNKKQDYPDTLNVLFYDDVSSRVFFLGGRNIYELCLMNVKASELYDVELPALIDNIMDNDVEIKKYIEDYRAIDMPFSISMYQKESGFVKPTYTTEGVEQKIRNTLSQDKNIIKNIHIDTRHDYHIDGFYLYENIFLNSETVDGISFWLGENILKANNSNIVLIGTDKYAELVIAKTKSILIDKCTISSFVLTNFKKSSLQQLVSFYKNINNSSALFIIFSPVVFTGLRVNEKIIMGIREHLRGLKLKEFSWSQLKRGVVLLDYYKTWTRFFDGDIKWFSAIKSGKKKIEIKNQTVLDYEYIINIDLETTGSGFNSYEISDKTLCPVCTNSLEEEPLYKMDRFNSYKIDDYYSGAYEKKNFKPYANNSIYLYWEKSIYFTHAVRGNNHFTYYINTPMFLEENRPSIIKYLEAKNVEQKMHNYILLPQHDTNNDFATLVNEIVFKNNAIILQIDNLDTETNLSKLDITHSRRNIGLYFLDDTIASGKTLEYLYILLKAKNKDYDFDGAFVLLDRMTVYDENVVTNYFTSPDDNPIYSFAQLEINPIKTAHDIKECFLCTRQQDYINYLQDSVLDMNRFQAAKRVVGLHGKDYRSLSDKDYYGNAEYQIKTFIKMKAVEFVYKKTIKKDLNKEDFILYYNEIEKEYVSSITKELFKHIYIKDNMFGDNLDIFTSILEKITEHEAKIALLKALTFPKLVYYKHIRSMATYVIIHRIKQEKQNYEKLLNFFVGGFNFKTNESLGLLPNDVQKFLETYKEKKQIDYLNFLYRVAGYLNITYILNQDNIKFFFDVTAEAIRSYNAKRDNEKDIAYEGDIKGAALSSYPFAVKMVSSESRDKSIYLKEQLEKFYSDIQYPETYDSYFTMIHALELENNIVYKEKFQEKSFCLILEKNDFSIEEKIDELQKVVLAYIKNTRDKNKFKQKNTFKSDFAIENIYINENLNIEYNTYKEYLDGSTLRDVSNGFNELTITKNSSIDKLYKGAKAQKGTSKIEHLYQHDIHEINVTWANLFVEQVENGKAYSIIRLVDINIDKLKRKADFDNREEYNDTLWFRPIGCIVLSHNSNYEGHLEYSKSILAIQNNLVNFFKEEFSHETFKEAVTNKELDDVLIGYSHTTAPMLDISTQLEYIRDELVDKCKNKKYSIEDYVGFDNLMDYTYGVSKISSLGRLLNDKNLKTENSNNLFEILNNNNKKSLEKFFYAAKEMDKVDSSLNLLFDDSIKEIYLPMSEDNILIIFFELFYNAAKYSNVEEEASCEILVSAKDNYISIKNTANVAEKDSNQKGHGSAHTYMKKIFKKINYKFLDPIITDNSYEIRLQRRTGDD